MKHEPISSGYYKVEYSEDERREPGHLRENMLHTPPRSVSNEIAERYVQAAKEGAVKVLVRTVREVIVKITTKA